jgi:hypothetical protein
MRWVAVAGLLSFAGCSLMGLDEFELVRCREDSDCEVANRANPDPDGCGGYECGEDGVCRLPSNVEICDGEDNDCNGWIDEGIAGIRDVEHQFEGGNTDTPFAFATEPSSRATYVVAGGSGARGWVIDGPNLADPATTLSYESTGAEPERPCPTRTGPVGCSFSEVAVAADEEHLVYATVNRQGCDDGDLRIGLSERRESPFRLWLGKSADARTQDESSIAYGVDVDSDSRCTGASREGQDEAGSVLGATRPVVASLDTRPGAPGALAVWLASSSADADDPTSYCRPEVSVDVEALGVFVRSRESGWLDGSDEGRPIVIGRTASLSHPAVVAVPSTSSFVTAFVAEQTGQRGIQLVHVAPTGDRIVPTLRDFVSDAGAAQVTLATGSGEAEVALAWSSSCEKTPALRFLTLRSTDIQTAGQEVITIETDGEPLDPRLIYFSTGFSVARPAGGWFLLWSEWGTGNIRKLKFARIAAHGPRVLNVGTLLEAPGVPVTYGTDESRLRYALLREFEDGTLQINANDEGWCDDME